MRDFLVRGTDPQSGYTDEIVVTAADAGAALAEGTRRGLLNADAQPLVFAHKSYETMIAPMPSGPYMAPIASFFLWAWIVVAVLFTLLGLAVAADTYGSLRMLFHMGIVLVGGIMSVAVPLSLLAIIQLLQQRSRL